MSDPTHIGEIFLDFNPGEASPEDEQRYRETARIDAAHRLAALFEAHNDVLTVEDADPVLTKRLADELKDESLEIRAQQHERKGNG